MSRKSVRVVLIFIAALATAMCSSSSSPTSPTPPPVANNPPPTPPPAPPPPARTGSISISVNPNPVPFSGQPITDAASCAGSRNTWFYDLIIQETGGAQVTLTNRVDAFDGRPVNDVSGLNITLSPNASTTIRARWCSATNAEHSAQTTFAGRDASNNEVKATTPMIRLMRQ